MQALTTLLRAQNMSVREEACRAFWNLTAGEDGCRYVESGGGVAELVKVNLPITNLPIPARCHISRYLWAGLPYTIGAP